MLCFSPLLTRPLCALPKHTLGDVVIACDTIIEARPANPLADLVADPRKRLVIAAEIVAVPLGE